MRIQIADCLDIKTGEQKNKHIIGTERHLSLSTNKNMMLEHVDFTRGTRYTTNVTAVTIIGVAIEVETENTIYKMKLV